MTQSPELAGGAGFTFGDQVATRFLACLLVEAYGPGMPDRIVCRVALEQRDAGEPLDDIVVDARATDGSFARLSLQVKRELTISAARTNDDFRDIVRDCWATMDKVDFRFGSDRVGAVTGPSVAARKARDLQTLAELARADASPDDFTRRFEQTGSASEELRVLHADLQAVTRSLARPAESADLYRLLSHFVLVRFDTLHEGATEDPNTTSLLQQALRIDQQEQAIHLFQHLQVLARKGAGRARSWTTGTLRLETARSFGLAIAPSLAPDLERLMAAVRPAIASIADRIGSTTVQRMRLQAKVNAELEKHRFVGIRGLPGAGKSALLREHLEVALRRGSVILLKSDRLEGGGWAFFAGRLGMRSLDPIPLLMEIAVTGTPVLFIDGLDRIDKAQRNIVIDLISSIERTPELGQWRVLATLRDSGIEPVRTWLPQFFDGGRFAPIVVDIFDDAEAQELAVARPGLRSLLFGAEPARSLVRRPFFAKILDAARSDQGDAPRSETELLSRWWRRGGFDAEGLDARLRQRVLLKIAHLRAQRADGPIPLDELDISLLEGVNQLVADGVLVETSNQLSIIFAHDIFFEWSFLQLLANAGRDWIVVVKEAGEPPFIGRAIELHSQIAFFSSCNDWNEAFATLANSNLRPQWRRMWLLGPIGHPDFSLNESCYDSALLAERNSALRLALVWFQAQHTIPSPLVLSGTVGEHFDRSRRLRVADSLGWPDDFARWSRFLNYLHSRIDKVPVEFLPQVLTLFEVWQNAAVDLPNTVSVMIVENAAAWLRELEHRHTPLVSTKPDSRWDKLVEAEDFERSLRRLLLRSARVEQGRVRDYLSSFEDKHDALRDIFEDVISFSPVLAQTHPRELAELTLRYLREELPQDIRRRRIEEERLAFAKIEELRRKPPEQRTRLDDLALTSPALGFWRPSHHDWEALALGGDQTYYFPASPLHEPFTSLFDYKPDDALWLVTSLTNHAVEAWRQLHVIQTDRGSPIPVEVGFPWGLRTFWGGSREYLWSRGLWAPKPLASAFLALDAWALDQVGEGVEPNELIRRVVDRNDSVAVLGIAVNIALAAGATSPITEALVLTQRLWKADVERSAQEASIRSSSQIGFWREDQEVSARAVKAHNTRSVRQVDLRQLAMKHVLDVDEDSARRVRAGICSFVDSPPFEFEEERDSIEQQMHYDEQARTHAAWGQLENYRLFDVPGQPDEQAIALVNPIAEEPEVKARLQEGSEHLEAFRLYQWAERSFERKRVHEDLTLDQALAAARDLDAIDLFQRIEDPHTSMRRGAVAGAAAAAIAFAPDEDNEWAWGIMERAARTVEGTDHFWSSVSILSWHPCMFVTRALNAALRRRPSDRSVLVDLMTFTTHPLDCVAFEAARQLVSLWDVAPRLAWDGLRLALDLCSVDASDLTSNVIHNPAFAAISRRAKLTAAIDGLEAAALPLPVPVRPWTRAPGPTRGRRTPRGLDPQDQWRLTDHWWRSELAAKLLRLVPLNVATSDPHFKQLFVAYLDAMLAWTIDRTAPEWDEDGHTINDRADCFDWVRGFAEVLGEFVGLIEAQQADKDFIQPICRLRDDPCFALLSPLMTMFLCTHVLDAPAVLPITGLLLDRALDRLLTIPEFRRGRYRAGDLYGSDKPHLARWLMFVGVERAEFARRFANGDWSEVELILPTVDRFVREAGWAPSIMGHFLTLVERAHTHYPVDMFADAILSVLTSRLDLKWRGTLIAARIAACVQDFSDRDTPLPPPLGQKLLRILDLLVELGDRRSAALQLSPAFRDLRLPSTNS